MNLNDFMYELPEELIAQVPVEPRDVSRLMVWEGPGKALSHRRFFEITEYLRPGDALVVNETRVMPARLLGLREGGGPCEVLLLKQLAPKQWEVLAKPGKKLRPGAKVYFGDGKLIGTMIDSLETGGRIVEFECEGTFEAALDALGEMPLPPYIREKLEDGERYQTVYAKEVGSAAAPTAGLHFTDALLTKIRNMGVDVVPILLHVGLGTFRPVKVEEIESHKMHGEYYSVSKDAAERISACRARGGRVVAVGTTSVRTLETASTSEGVVEAGSGWTDIFIYPGYTFKAVDALVTNFHLPGSTLLMLVSAFMSREEAMSAYGEAVKERYRFFSFGDAMLILNGKN